MPRFKRNQPPVPGPPEQKEGSVRRLTAEPWAAPLQHKAPSQMVLDTIEHNAERIRLVARYSAMQAMPMILARGEQTTLQEQENALRETIGELVRRAIDDGGGHEQDNCGVFCIEVAIAEQLGEEFTDKAKNLYVVEVDISIPLEYTVIEFPPQHYTKGKKVAEKWFKE